MAEKRKENKNAEVFKIGLITSCGTFDDILKDAQELYDEGRAEFMASDASDNDFPEKAAEWAESSLHLIRAAASEMCAYPADVERQEKALHIMEVCKNDSYLREVNLKLHYDVFRKKDIGKEQLRAKRRALRDGIHFATRARNTQIAWARKFLHGEAYEDPEMKYAKEHGKDIHDMMLAVPEGHRFYPARIYPPYRVPAGQRVPYPPDAFTLWKKQPAHAFIYDSEYDEYILPKDYVSEDGRITGESVVFNWEEGTVTMRMAGEETVTWPFWKARKSTDLMEPGSWCEEYQLRVYRQMEEDLAPPGFREEPRSCQLPVAGSQLNSVSLRDRLK